jgi:hypothetical protein
MYKFEISADSPQELQEKMIEFANEYKTSEEADEYVNDPIPAFVEPMVIPVVEKFSSPNDGSIGTNILETVTAVPKPTPEVDSKGVIYDPTIHSANKSVNADGSWRMRRGVDKSKVKEKETVATPEPFVAPPPPAPVEQPVNTFPGMINPVVGPTAAVPQVLPVVEPVVIQPVNTPSYDPIPTPAGARPAYLASFKNNITLVFANLINEKKIDQAYVEQLKSHFKVKEVWDILKDEKSSQELFNFFGQLGFITMV